ncbi:Cyclin-dependent kinase 10 [Clydaea vesicula]|uniref:cyclin-dependent kinase n=1 Tax=Clydaea vesicula TaxID=447962 RepID=A0AAD5TWH9_9FUNG|nr:Cyclin-dependent kinase 10 [Clydaea vesicula]KAJ3386475.1 Cyclin-dependent kinase 10 [Lobulomyces angularis]
MILETFTSSDVKISEKYLENLTVEKYEKLNRVGEGTYGIVYRAKLKSTNKIYALKKIRFNNENEGLPISSLREISLLRELDHINIVRVKEVVTGVKLDDIFMVMEYCDQDLAFLLDNMTNNSKYFRPAEVKCLLKQLLKGLDHLHENFIIHRDLKMSNLLLTANGTLKIADFGLARKFTMPVKPMTQKVVTLWYRAPELLFGEINYTKKIDMWSVGCIFSELILGEPLLPGKVELEQINLIIKLFGTPNEKIWPGFKDLPLNKLLKNIPFQEYNNLRQRFKNSNVTSLTLKFVEKFFIFNSEKRINCYAALKDDYFKEKPFECAKSNLPTFPEFRGENNLNKNDFNNENNKKRRRFDFRNVEDVNQLDIGEPIIKRYDEVKREDFDEDSVSDDESKFNDPDDLPPPRKYANIDHWV